MAFLEINNVSKHFGKDTVAVEDFNLQVEKGELVSFLGPSGCGKTTTLRMVAGFELPSTGNIVINGNDVTNIPPNQRKVGMVFRMLFSHDRGGQHRLWHEDRQEAR
jgi:putative spermidine/putrescine transport system ATP-binding protein